MVVIKWADKEKKGGEKRFAKGIGLSEDVVELGGVSHEAYAREATKYMSARCERCHHTRADHQYNFAEQSTPCSDSWGHYTCQCKRFVEYGELESRSM